MSNPQGGQDNSLGMTIGASNLAATGNGLRPVIRPAAVTLDRGLVLTGFVDRVGDPVPLIAEDGSRHRPETLLVEALDGLARSAANRAPVSEVGVTVPAHWRPPVVATLRTALQSKPGLSRALVVPDATAALVALRANQGLPTAGVIALCDFGGSGTSITLVDAAKDAVIGETVRVLDFSGDHIDQAILAGVVRGLVEASAADPSGTAMVGSLAKLRDECRRAKERLSDQTATGIIVDLPGLETTIRMTRMELDDLVDGQLAKFFESLGDALDRNRVPLASVSAVATVGGGARIPLITQRLSEHLRVPVITSPVPQLTAAQGVALIAHRSQVVETATALAPAAPLTATVAAAAFGTAGTSTAVGALAWSEVDDDLADLPGSEISSETFFNNPYDIPRGDGRPEVHFTRDEWAGEAPGRRRGPVVLFGIAAAAAAIGAAVFGLTAITGDTSTVPAGTASTITPAPIAAPASAPAAQVAAPAAPSVEAPAPQVTTVVAQTQPQVVQQPAAAEQAPQPPASEPAAPAPEPAAPAPEPEAPAPSAENPAPPATPWTPPWTRPGWTPPWNPPNSSGTGTGGTGTPPTDPGTGGAGTGTGNTGTATGSDGGGTGSGHTPTGAGTNPENGTGTGAGGGAKAHTDPGLVAPILEPVLPTTP